MKTNYSRTMELHWFTRTRDGRLIDFYDVDLTGETSHGVFVLYRDRSETAQSRRIVYVGRGVIGDCIAKARQDPSILARDSVANPLKVAFAPVIPEHRRYVEHFLVWAYAPELAEPISAPDTAVPVRLPSLREVRGGSH